MHSIIMNPVAGRGRATRQCALLCGYLTQKAIPYTICETQKPDHATQLAKEAVQASPEAVWSLGGDGTLKEVAAGLLGSGVPLGILPCGTGNDLARSLGLPLNDAIAAFEAQDTKNRRNIDVWLANGKSFLSTAGAGFDAQTLVHSRRFRGLPGSMLPYLTSLMANLFTHKPIQARVTLDGVEYPGPFLLVSLCNGRFFGGGMPIAPEADPHDGLMDVVLIQGVSRLRVPFLLPKFFRAKHIELSITKVVRAADVTLRFNRAEWFGYDGDLFQSEEIHIRLSEEHLECLALRRDG